MYHIGDQYHEGAEYNRYALKKIDERNLSPRRKSKLAGWYEDRIAEEEAMCEKLKAVGHEIYMQIKEAKEKGEK